MTPDIALTLAVLAFVIIGLVTNRISADLILMAAVTVLLMFGVVEPARAFSGFSNTGVITIAVLYIIAAALIETGAVQWVANLLLGNPKSVAVAQIRLLFPTAALSAFINNTAVVAIFIPAVQEWSTRLNIAPSKLLLPLSYAAIIGGTCTIIGTSTNLIVYGLLQDTFQISLNFFEIAYVGVPLVIIGAAYLSFFGDKLLPNRLNTQEQMSELRQYSVQFEVSTSGSTVGKTIEQAGLRNLNSGYLIEIERDGKLFSAVSPQWLLEAGDLLVFIGAPELAAELRSIRGIHPASHDLSKLSVENQKRRFVEVVLGPEFPGIGQSVKESKFRTRYNAVIISVSRGIERLPGKVGDLVFKVGDTLLLEAADEFVENYKFRKDFLLVSTLNESAPPDFHKAPRALLIMLAMITSTVLGWTTILESAMLAAGAMLLTGCVSAAKSRRQIDLQVLVVIAGAFGLGAALSDSGAATLLANTLLPNSLTNPYTALIIIYVLTVLFTEVITNNAAAILMFPIAQTFAERLEVSILPFAFAIMIAASASFITPLGYQTNLMVYGPGQYRYLDYIKLGLPLSILVAILSLWLIPQIWFF